MKLNHYGMECNVAVRIRVASKFTVPCTNLFKHTLCMCAHMYANSASELNSGLIHSAVWIWSPCINLFCSLAPRLQNRKKEHRFPIYALFFCPAHLKSNSSAGCGGKAALWSDSLIGITLARFLPIKDTVARSLQLEELLFVVPRQQAKTNPITPTANRTLSTAAATVITHVTRIL